MPRADKEARNEYARELYARRKAEVSTTRRERYALDDEYRQEYLRKQREVYAPRHQAKRRERQHNLNQEQKLGVLDYYSNGTLACKHCRIEDPDVLTIDHINGGGTQARKEHENNHTYRWLIQNGLPDGFQVLCFNCNWKKRLTN